MSNFWRCYSGGWRDSGQVNDNIYFCDSPSMKLEGPWPTPQFLITQGFYTHVNDPSVAIYNGTWYMFYSAAPLPTKGDDTINYSTSPDGINWNPSVGTTNTAVKITDPLGIEIAEITDVARPAVVFAPDCVKLWFDGFLTNNLAAAEMYLAEAPYSDMFNFTVKHKYDNHQLLEPDVVLRGDGTYFAAYNKMFREISCNKRHSPRFYLSVSK